MKQTDHEYRIRYRHSVASGHYFCRVFSRPKGQATWAKLGVLVLRDAEWESFKLSWAGVECVKEIDND